jgi:hypothetical protein
MKSTFTKTTLIIHLALAIAFLFAGLTRAAAQTTSNSTSTSNTPALIMSFNGQVTNNAANLTWVMENETNSKWFVIERSGDDGEYDSIGVVTGINNNNSTSTYTYSDNNMLNGNNYYRLRMVDMDNVVRYSKIVSLYDLQQTETASSKMTIFPNPAAATINYTVASSSNQQVIVQVYNLAGVVLLTAEQQLNAGNNVQTIAVSSLKAGNYFLKITNVEGSSQYVQPFVKIM